MAVLSPKAGALQVYGHKMSLFTMEYVKRHLPLVQVLHLTPNHAICTTADYLDTIDTTAEICTPPVVKYDDDNDKTTLDEGCPSNIGPTSRINML
ncbi:hypothetical protein BGZ94_001734 [Podila epigama]|nr:hypothetical protein BGZ94_001734 [Podila epigama]